MAGATSRRIETVNERRLPPIARLCRVTVRTVGAARKPSLGDILISLEAMSHTTFSPSSILSRLRKEEDAGDVFLLPFKHEDGRLTLADRAYDPGQRLEVGGKLAPLGPRDLAIDLVDDFQSALVHPAR